MTALEADWYNRVLPGSRAMAPVEESSALPVYLSAAGYVDPGVDVVDIGCGTGRFAELLRRRGDISSYVGFDFAADVVDEARRYCRDPRFRFEVDDLRFWEPAGPATFVLLEVLEHLDYDIGILRKLPPGSPVVLSVPSFWSESHVRVFPDIRDAMLRYAKVLDFGSRHSIVFDTSERNTIHVYRAVKR